MMSLLTVFAASFAWETVFQVVAAVLRSVAPSLTQDHAARDKLVRFGPSYAVSLLHAMIVSCLGCWHITNLWSAPLDVKLRIPSVDHPFYVAASDTEYSNVLFLSYLMYDIVHILLEYPKLGGVDILSHHLAFATASIVCGKYRMLPFAFAWLLLCELSSIPLNVRWFLLSCGQSVHVTNKVFAALFFLARICIYPAGLLDLIVHRDGLFEPRPDSIGVGAVPAILVYIMVLLLSAGLVLNVLWFRKILRLASRSGISKVKD